MTRIVFFIVSVLYASNAQSQQLATYYNYVNKAELHITVDQLDSSFYYYKKAFAAWPTPFGRDIYNAAIVTAKQKKYTYTAQYLTRLLKLGARHADIAEKPALLSFLQSPAGKKFTRLAPRTKPTYNKIYRKKIEALIAADQLFRTKKGAYSLYADTIKKIDKQNIDALLQLINQYGFPTEARVGIKDIEGLIIPLYSTIIIHQSNGPWQQYNFSALLKENILKGNIENKAGIYMINRSDGSNFFEAVQIQYIKAKDSLASLSNPANYTVLEASDWGYYPLSEKEAAVINAKRKALFLENYDENLSKLLFSIKNPAYLLAAFGSKSTINLVKYEDYINEKKNLKYQ